jgi:DNA-binding winged helix-turn-helix (wHTH) protein
MRYTFQNVEIDDTCFAIWRNGVFIASEPRILEFIFYLVRNRDRMVSKRELLEQVWRQPSISESVLTRAACLARKLLGNSALIRTVYGRGYQWAAAPKKAWIKRAQRLRKRIGAYRQF